MTVPDGVVVHDPDRGELLHWSVGAPLALGYMSARVCVAGEVSGVPFPTRAVLSAGHQWRTGDQLRAAARMLDAVADELDAAIAGDGAQLSIEEVGS